VSTKIWTFALAQNENVKTDTNLWRQSNLRRNSTRRWGWIQRTC